MPPLSDWEPLLSVQAEAAATLMGLVFVAVSINLRKILEIPGLPGRAAESLLHFLQVFFVCTALLIPQQPTRALAVEILAIAILSWIIQGIAQIRYAKHRGSHPLSWLMMRIVQTQCASVPFFVAALSLILGWPTGLYWIVPGFVFSFVAGIINAWILLIEIVR